MDSSHFHNQLVASINKLSVNGGKPTMSTVDYPASVDKKNPNVMYNIVDTSGNVVGTVASSIFTLGQKTVNTGIELGKGAVNITRDTLNTGLGITREGLLAATETVDTGVSSLHSLGQRGENTVYRGVSHLGTGAYNVVTNVGQTGFDITDRTLHGVRSIANDGIEGVRNSSNIVTNNIKGVGRTIGDTSSRGIDNFANNVKNVGITAVDTGSNLVHGVTKVGEHALNTVVDLTHDVVKGTLDVGSKIVNSGVDFVNNGVNTGKNILNDGVNTGVDVVNDIGQTVYEVGEEGLETGAHLAHDAIHGVKEVSNVGINTTKRLINTGQSRLHSTGSAISSGIDSIKNDLGHTGNNIKHGLLRGGDQSISGVSVSNLNNDSSRMLIPTHFLTSKHVYFVRYNSEGTNLYNFKLQMKGGKVHFLKQVSVNPVWKTNKFNDSAPDGMLVDGKKILNNLIADLKETQFGGLVEQRLQ
jgi:hypothetical protein